MAKKAAKAAKKASGGKKTAASASGKPRTKSEVINNVAEAAAISRQQAKEVFEAMSAMIKRDLGKGGPGTFTVPGLLKLRVIRKPATKARKGINPFTKEETIFKAKPARNVVKATALKALKDMV